LGRGFGTIAATAATAATAVAIAPDMERGLCEQCAIGVGVAAPRRREADAWGRLRRSPEGEHAGRDASYSRWGSKAPRCVEVSLLSWRRADLVDLVGDGFGAAGGELDD
jgi:hypothetical protein